MIAIKTTGTKSATPSAQAKGKSAVKSGPSLPPDLQPQLPPSALAVMQPMPIVPATPIMVAHVTQGHGDALSAGGPNAASAVSVGSPQTRLSNAGGNEWTQTPSGIQGQPVGPPGTSASSPNLGKISTSAPSAHHNAASMIGTPILAPPANSVADAAPTSATILTPAQPAAPNPASEQVSAALVASGPLNADGSHQLTIALAPPAIGPVTVAINRGADGTARIAISAVDPVTLSALRNDHAGITQALAQAGITAHESGISFQLASHAGVAITPIAQAASTSLLNSGAAHHSSDALSTGQGAVGHQGAGDQSMGQQGAGQPFGGRPSEPMPLASRAATLPGVAIGSEPGILSIHSSNLKKFGLDVTA
ncbi:MAG: flagellar hook-length control protein FliK [Acidiphilium sp.]